MRVFAQELGLPKGSNVVPFWVCYGFGVDDYNIVPKKELHRRVCVGLMDTTQSQG